MSWGDSTVLVTGASRGLGRVIATSFAARGAFVGIGYHHQEARARETLEAIREQGGCGELLQADVRRPADVNRAVKAFLARHEQIDVLVNNAAVVDDRPFALMSSENWSEVIETNLGGVFNCTRAVVRSMMARRRGAIVNIGSVAGQFASPGQANYAASKGGVLALTRTLAAELAPKGIRVNAVLPGLLTEGMARRLNRGFADSYRERIPLNRFGTPEEVAQAVIFLASEDAAYITGQHLVVDGGLTV